MTIYEKTKEMTKTEFVNLLLSIYNEGYENGRHWQCNYQSIVKIVDMDYEQFKTNH